MLPTVGGRVSDEVSLMLLPCVSSSRKAPWPSAVGSRLQDMGL